MKIENRVILYFKEWGIYDEVLKNNTVINTFDRDLLDIEMIFEQFFEQFNISNSETFNVDKYFYKIPFFKYTLIKFGFNVNIKPKPYITINHMIEVANKKKWFDPF